MTLAPRRARRRLTTSNIDGTSGSSPSSRRVATQRDRLLLVLLGVVLVVTLLALGGLPPWSLFGAGALLASALFIDREAATPRRASLVLWIFVGLATYTLLQTVPLPDSWLAHSSPEAARIWTRATKLVGYGTSWHPLSLDPGASSLEAFKFGSFALIYAIAFRVGVSGQRQALSALVFGSGLLLTLIGLAHTIFAATKVYGLYEPSFPVAARHLGPLLNQNHVAGYLILAGFSGLSLPRPADPVTHGARLAGVAWLFACIVLTGSRGGVGALVVGSIVYLALRPRVSSARRWAPFVGLGLASCAFVAFGASEGTWRELLGRDVEKLRLLGDSWRLLTDFPAFGVGRGAFGSLSSNYHTIPDNIVFTHPENLPLQWLTEWGIPVSLAAAVLLAFAFRPSTMISQSHSGAAIFAGALALLAQNFLDFSSEVPAVAFAWLSLVAAAQGHVARKKQLVTTTSRPFAPPRVAAMIVVGVAAGALLLRGGPHELRSERIQLERRTLATLQGPRERVVELRSELSRAVMRHPADYFIPRLRGLLNLDRSDEAALPWIGYSLERCLACGRTHLLLAGAIGRKNVDQALLHVRWAVQTDNTLPAEAAMFATRLTRDPARLSKSVPPAPGGAAYALELAARLDDDVSRLPLLELAASRSPGDTTIQLRWLDTLFNARRREGVEPRLRRALDELQRDAALRHWVTLYRLLLESHSPAATLPSIEALCAAHSELEPRCSSEMIRVAARIDDPRTFLRVTTSARENACRSACECAVILELVGSIQESRSEFPSAAHSLFEAAESCPNADRYLRAAAVAERGALHSVALRAYQNAEQFGSNPEIVRNIERLSRGFPAPQ